MGDDDPTEFAESAEADPTEFAGVADADTMSAYAWGLEDEAEESASRSGRWITVAAVTAAGLLVTAVAALAIHQLRTNESTSSAAETTTAEPTAPSVKTVTVTPAPPPAAAPPPVAVPAQEATPAQASAVSAITTYIGWTGTPCIYIRFPSGGQMVERMTCNPGGSDAVQHPAAVSGSLVGVDPIMGQATSISCRVMVDAIQKTLRYDTGTAGDGHDINCIVQAP